MAVELVEVVNPNGRIGRVAVTSGAASAYKNPPSKRTAGPKPTESSDSGKKED